MLTFQLPEQWTRLQKGYGADLLLLACEYKRYPLPCSTLTPARREVVAFLNREKFLVISPRTTADGPVIWIRLTKRAIRQSKRSQRAKVQEFLSGGHK